jgi:Zn-dependent peptidase ImmA (M78 family)/transcriptional regulator with XRE-family HTH domain
MATSMHAHVTPDVLRWARESIGYPLEEAARRIDVRPEKLERAEQGEVLLTLRQAEKAANVYDRPLAALFLPAPPVEEAQETQYRRLPGAPEPPWPPQMQVLARRIRGRQEAAAELYELLDEGSPWLEARAEFGDNPEWHARTARKLLGISLAEQTSWRDPTGYRPLRHWVDAVESLGVLVMQDGTLPVEMVRGFASTHPAVPAVVVNTQDDARARAFTAVHELGHLTLEATGQPVGPQTESWCDDFAGEVLMPPAALEEVFARVTIRDPLDRIDEVALTFGVTPLGAAVTARRRELLPRETSNVVIERIRERGARSQAGGGNYYWTQLGRLGPAFTRLVFDALDGQSLTYPAAAGLLGVKVNNFGTLREYVQRRSELE